MSPSAIKNLSNSKLHLFFKRLHNTHLILLFVVINYLLSHVFSYLSRSISNHALSAGFVGFIDNQEAILLAIIIAPIAETLVFQYGIIETFRAKRSLPFCCFISAISFAAFHVYNIYYFFLTFIAGLLLAYIYLLKKTTMSGILVTCLAHLSFNTLVFALSQLH